MNRYEKYCERQTWYPDSNVNYLCIKCRSVFKQEKYRDECKCPNCGSKMRMLGIFTKVPRKKASDATWRKFFKKEYIDVPIV